MLAVFDHSREQLERLVVALGCSPTLKKAHDFISRPFRPNAADKPISIFR